jgi:serine/threonine-protein kinase HipA
MARRYKLDRAGQRVPHLLRLLAGQGLGALLYAEEGAPSPSTGVSRHHLAELFQQAEKFETDPSDMADEELALLFQAASSPGGARPKALVHDESSAFLAKFASTRDQFDVVSLEAAAMELARRAGVDTAETSILALGSRKCLLVKRFDIHSKGGRNHLISMQSLLKADGYYNSGYRDMAGVLMRVSSNPQRDLRMLYRQMVFNVMIGNTDDHLKNFCLLHDEAGWRLTPAFDLTPNIGPLNQEHVLRIGLDTWTPDANTLLAEAKYFGIKRRQQAKDLLNEVYEAAKTWKDIFAAYQVPEQDAQTIGKDIQLRLNKVAPDSA